MSEDENGTTVAVTSKGQATIPKEFREKLRIDTPGRVRFVENEEGDVVIRPIERPAELRGSLSAAERGSGDDRSATEMLREERARDEERANEKYGLTEREE